MPSPQERRRKHRREALPYHVGLGLPDQRRDRLGPEPGTLQPTGEVVPRGDGKRVRSQGRAVERRWKVKERQWKGQGKAAKAVGKSRKGSGEVSGKVNGRLWEDQ